MKLTASERKAVKVLYDGLDNVYVDGMVGGRKLEVCVAKQFKMPVSRLREVADYISESRLFTDNGKTMIRR